MSQDPTDGRLAEHLDWLAMECETGATWRRLQTELYPGDARNEFSAAALDRAAGELRSASVADYRQQLTSIAAVDADQRFSLEKRYLIGRHGLRSGGHRDHRRAGQRNRRPSSHRRGADAVSTAVSATPARAESAVRLSSDASAIVPVTVLETEVIRRFFSCLAEYDRDTISGADLDAPVPAAASSACATGRAAGGPQCPRRHRTTDSFAGRDIRRCSQGDSMACGPDRG